MGKNNLEFVQNNPDYYNFIRKLRNDDRVRGGFIVQTWITKKQQQQYMNKYGDFYYICLYDGKPAGYVGQIDGDIRVAAHPNFQKKGVGKFMIDELMKLYPKSYAKVKLENTAGLKLFEKSGFKKKFYILKKDE